MESATCPFCDSAGRKEAATAYAQTFRYTFECGTFGQQLNYSGSKPKFKMSGECARRTSSKQKPITQEEVNAR